MFEYEVIAVAEGSHDHRPHQLHIEVAWIVLKTIEAGQVEVPGIGLGGAGRCCSAFAWFDGNSGFDVPRFVGPDLAALAGVNRIDGN